MPNRSLFLLLSLIAIAATAASAALGGDRKFVVVGEYEPIKNLKDPHVVEIAHFAVDQHNKQSGDRLQLVKIVKGEQQLVEGMNYRLVIEAKDGGVERNYQAIVYESQSEKFRKLTTFKPLINDAATAASAALGGDKKRIVGGYEPIKNLTDPYVVEIAQFAVDQHNKQSGDHLQLVKIVKGEQQVVAGMNYRLVIKAKHGGAEHKYMAIVYDRPWDHFRKLISFTPFIHGEYEPIKNLKDPHVVEIAQFAVDQHNKQSSDRLQLVKIVKGEQKVVAGMKYRLVIEAKDGGVERKYQAIVYERRWVHFRQLISFKPLIFGGYEPIKNLKDPHVVEIAQFAVDQHNNQSGDHLQLVKIVKGEQQVVAGMNYRLVIEAKDGGVERKYQVIVYERRWEHFRQLTSFKPLFLGGYEPIKNLKDPHVVEIAQFAVDQHNKQSGDHLQLVKIVKGEQQLVAGFNYRLLIKAKDGGVERNYQAIVYERSWAKIRKLTSFKPLIADAATDASAALGGDRKVVVVGAYEPIKNLKDPHVVEIAQFAVDQHNKQSGDHLQLVKIVKGEQQVVAGTNYCLVIEAKDGGIERNYQAIVYESLSGKFRKLTSFKPLIADAATAVSAALGGDRKVVVGAYEPIKNLKDPHVVEIAQFAVDQHNKQSGDRLQLVKIVKGEQQVVAGMNYRLVIEAKDGGVERNYQAIVYERSWAKIRKLTSFKPLIADAAADAATAASAALGGDRQRIAGGYEPIKNLTDPHVVEIAQFAVDQLNKQSGDRLQLVKIVKGEQQVVAGINYRLVIKAKDGGAERNYEAIIYDRPWDKIRKLISFKQMLT